MSAIERLGIGVVDKIFLTFDAEDMPAHNQLARFYQLLWKQDAAELLPGSDPALLGACSPPGKCRVQQQTTACHAGASAVQEQSAVERCIAAAKGNKPADIGHWQRGLYSVRMGGAEFIRGSTKLANATKVSRRCTPAWLLTTPSRATSVKETIARPFSTSLHTDFQVCIFRVLCHGRGLRLSLPCTAYNHRHLLTALVCPVQVKDQVQHDTAALNGAQVDEGEDRGSPGRSCVCWVSSHPASSMELVPDEQLRVGIHAALDAFPALDLPRSFTVSTSPACQPWYGASSGCMHAENLLVCE